MKQRLKILFYTIWGLTPVVFMIFILAFIGAIPFPRCVKIYNLNTSDFDMIVQRIDSLPSKVLNLEEYKDNYDLPRYCVNHQNDRIEFIHWPLDSVTFATFDLIKGNKSIHLSDCYVWEGSSLSYIDINHQGSLIEQIKFTQKFENTVLKNIKFKSDTNLFQDCLDHAKRRMVEFFLWWPLIALVSFLIYWECYGNPFARPEED